MKNVSHWKLVALFGGLVVVFAAVRFFLSPTRESNLPAYLTDIDSAAVTGLIIKSSKGQGEQVQILKSGGWKLMKGSQTLRLEQGAGVNALTVLMRLRPERMVSMKETKWDEFSVGDTTGTRVKVMAGNAVEADLWIGRSGFSPAPGQQYGGKTFTYVRLADANEVYAVEGFLEAQFSRRPDNWRDKSFSRLKRDSVDLITFNYPGDSTFVLKKDFGKWMMVNQRAGQVALRADSSAVVTYLTGMEFRNVSDFVDAAPTGNSPIVITFEKAGKVVVKIDAWPGAGNWTIRSTHQPETYFSAERSVIGEVFAGSKKFRPKGLNMQRGPVFP